MLKKTKVIEFSEDRNIQCDIKLNGVFFPVIRHLGSLIIKDGGLQTETKITVAVAKYFGSEKSSLQEM